MPTAVVTINTVDDLLYYLGTLQIPIGTLCQLMPDAESAYQLRDLLVDAVCVGKLKNAICTPDIYCRLDEALDALKTDNYPEDARKIILLTKFLSISR
jgi:hypothetical protein